MYHQCSHALDLRRRTVESDGPVQREVLTSIDSTQALKANVPWVMPFEKIPRFVGRLTELANFGR